MNTPPSQAQLEVQVQHTHLHVHLAGERHEVLGVDVVLEELDTPRGHSFHPQPRLGFLPWAENVERVDLGVRGRRAHHSEGIWVEGADPDVIAEAVRHLPDPLHDLLEVVSTTERLRVRVGQGAEDHHLHQSQGLVE